MSGTTATATRSQLLLDGLEASRPRARIFETALRFRQKRRRTGQNTAVRCAVRSFLMLLRCWAATSSGAKRARARMSNWHGRSTGTHRKCRRARLTAPRCETTSNPRNARKRINLGRFQFDQFEDPEFIGPSNGQKSNPTLILRGFMAAPLTLRTCVKANSVDKSQRQNRRRIALEVHWRYTQSENQRKMPIS